MKRKRDTFFNTQKELLAPHNCAFCIPFLLLLEKIKEERKGKFLNLGAAATGRGTQGSPGEAAAAAPPSRWGWCRALIAICRPERMVCCHRSCNFRFNFRYKLNQSMSSPWYHHQKAVFFSFYCVEHKGIMLLLPRVIIQQEGIVWHGDGVVGHHSSHVGNDLKSKD